MITRQFACVILLAFIATNVFADIFRPAYLELRELDNDRYAVLWKVPAMGEDGGLSLQVRLPDGTEPLSAPRKININGSWIVRQEVFFAGGFAGQVISLEGGAVGVTDVIARIERQDGSSQVARLQMDSPEFIVEPATGTGAVAWSYLKLGIEHILSGVDHLLFVLALLLIVKGGYRIVGTITAFTAAHSLTLAGAAVGWLHVPGPPVEAVIALSIVFVAAECLRGRQGRSGLTERAPWIVAFSFGLLHGFGFAGALAEIGLPENAIPVALVTFNLGVETGQLLFVALILTLRNFAERFTPRLFSWVPGTTAYGIGAIAAFWTIERVLSFSA